MSSLDFYNMLVGNFAKDRRSKCYNLKNYLFFLDFFSACLQFTAHFMTEHVLGNFISGAG